ncbi:MAG TPA: hypothetical protein ENJ95_07150 [Bacteroidetes bacterium]|nr:hypothetical protein [Bacteroidota bacterium]
MLAFNCGGGLLLNPEFENNFSDWDFYSNSNITNDAYTGINAAFVSGAAGGVGKNIVAYENEVYSLEAYAKKSGTENASVGIKFLDSGYNEIDGVYTDIVSSNYQVYQLSAKAPAGTAYVQAVGWKDAGSGTATFDSFCFQNWDTPDPVCQGKSCELSPSWGNYVWAMDDSGTGDNWKDYDLGGLMICDNEDGTLALKGNIINGHDSDWSPSIATQCGPQDGWYLDLTLSDRQTWAQFQGSYVQNNGCGANHVDWDYWQIAGTLIGTGCNTGRTINIVSSANGYRAQIGWGGNSQTCDFGISTWMQATENGNPVSADLYAHLDAVCYKDLDPEVCANGIDDDGDGLIDCYDPDCGTQLIQNESFEDAGSTVFNTTFQGSPAYAMPNGSTIIPNWSMDYGCGGNCFDSYWIDDTADNVNNPKGDYFIWMPGASYCAGQDIAVDLNKCYEITVVAAAWSDPSPQTPTTLEFEAYGGGIDDNGGTLSLFKTVLPASPNWQNLNWQTIRFEWSPPINATTRMYISQNNTEAQAKGIVIDQILIKEICCAGNPVPPEISCEDGRDVELNFVGINNNVPNTLNISDVATIDSVIVEVVYKGGNPGNSITVEDDNSNSYIALKNPVGSGAYVYRAVLPPTASVNYSNTSVMDKAQSLSAFVFRNSQPGKTVVTSFTTIGGYANTYTLDFNIPKGIIARNVRLTLPISELTYDDRSLDFVATAGSVSTSFSRAWGPNGLGFPNGCCIDTVQIFLPDVAPDVDLVSVDVISPGGGAGQSFVIAATVAVEVFCEEICGNGIDDDGDGYVDNEDQDCLCPDIYTSDTTIVDICEGDTVVFNVHSNAPNPPYGHFEFYRFDTPQANPYITGDPHVWLGWFANTNNGTGSISSDNFPATGNANATYYVYACLKPEPQDPTTCSPFVEYVVNVKPGTVITTSADPTICSGDNTLISASANGGSGPYSFVWGQGLGSGADQTVSPSASTGYTVTVTSGNGCTDEGSVMVSVNPSPSVNAGDDVAICVSESTTLTAVGSGGTLPYTYQWSNGLGSGDTKFVSPSANTAYSVTLTSGNGCNATDAVTVSVSSCTENCYNGLDDDGDGLVDCEDPDCAPIPTAGNDLTICIGSDATLTASVPNGNGSYNYVWSNGLGVGPVVVATPLVTTTFTVTVTNAAGCSGTAAVTVTVNNCPEVCADGIDNDGDGLIDCDDPDCSAVGAPSLTDDEFTACPALPFSERVNLNDANLQDPVYSISFYPSNGALSIDGTGKFTYTPYTVSCGVDQFVYQVCNQVSGCCASATVILNIGDTNPPVLYDVPADVTIGCDETVPDPSQVLAYDECPGIYIEFEEVTNEYVVGACAGYTITRTWIATDLCGNSATAEQVITVEDLEAPELFRVYTLANGKRLLAGVSQRVTDNWKYVPFPVTFAETPVVFSQVTSANDGAAVSVLHRNVTDQGFELRLREAEASDGVHLPEQVAWLAMEPGAVSGNFEAGTLPAVSDAAQALALGQSFPSIPGFLFSTQTVNETDPTTVRLLNVAVDGLDLFLDEETSKDSETSHAAEAVAYLAVGQNGLADEDGDLVAETGSLGLTNAWATVNLNNSFTKPSVIFGGISNNEPEPVTVRVRNVTANSFEARLQEWDGQDGSHAAETVSYLVVEGGLPDDLATYCEPDSFKLQPNVNVFVRDNCDNQVTLSYAETSNLLANGLQIQRTWTADDDCGNSLTFTRDDACTIAAIRLKTLLYGAAIGNGGGTLMRDDLRSKGFLPVNEPYSDLSYFAHKGKGGGETVPATMFDIAGDSAVVDWVFVEVRDSADNSKVLATKSVLLQRNGAMENTKGEQVIYFPELKEGSYNIAVRHRNHLGMMSGQSWAMSSVNIPTLDFSDLNVSVYDKENAYTIYNGKRAQWAGDFNGNRQIVYQGPYNDVFFLFSKVMGDPGNVSYLANYISNDYDRTDFDMDGQIIYQGPNNERAKLLYHAVLAHPLNTGFLANYIVVERLP